MSFNMINKRAYRSTWCTRRFFFPFSLSFNQNCNPNGSSSPKPTNQFLHCIRQVGGHEEEAHPFGPISLLGNFQLPMEDQITIPTHHIDWNSSYAANVGLLPFRGSSPCLLIILQCFQIIVVYRFFSFVTCLSFRVVIVSNSKSFLRYIYLFGVYFSLEFTSPIISNYNCCTILTYEFST